MHTGLGIYIPLALYLAVLGSCLVSMWGYPRIALYVLTFLLPLQTTREKLLQFPGASHLIYFLLIAVFVGIRVTHSEPLPRHALKGLLISWVVFNYLSLWYGSLYIDGPLPLAFSEPRFEMWRTLSLFPLCYLAAAYAVVNKRHIQWVLFFMCLSTMVVNRGFISSTAGRSFEHFSYDIRDASTLGYAGENGLAAFAAQMVLLIGTVATGAETKLQRIALYGCVAATFYTVLFTFSRGAYLGLGAGCLVLGFLRYKKLLLGLLLVAVMWQAILPASVQERIMSTRTSDGTLEPSANERMQIWDDAWDLVLASPIVGIGFNTYQYLHRVGGYNDTHNYYLKVLVEGGIVGLILFLWILIANVRMGYRLYSSCKDGFLRALGLGFAAQIVCVIVVNVFGDRFHYLQISGFTWIMMGCVVRAQEWAEYPLLSDSSEEVAPLRAPAAPAVLASA